MYEHDAHDDPASDDRVLRAVSDLAGIPVEDASGLSVGELFGALAEADSGLLRYIDLSLQRLDRHVLVPIGHARVRQAEREGPRIRLRAALLEELEQIPPFPADVSHIDDPFERALLEAYGRSFHGERYYAHPSYDHDGIYAGDHPVVADGEPDGSPAGEAGTAARADGGSEPRDATSSQDGATDAPGGVDAVRGPTAAVRPEAAPQAAGATGGAVNGHLRRLAYMPGWRVARGEPDIRRWPVALEDGARVEVRDLIVEPAASRVRYVVVSSPGGEAARLLPIGFLQVDEAAGMVRAPGLAAADVKALPEYAGGGLSRAEEDRVCSALRQRLEGRRRYALPDYRPDRRLS